MFFFHTKCMKAGMYFIVTGPYYELTTLQLLSSCLWLVVTIMDSERLTSGIRHSIIFPLFTLTVYF